jgi:hypothetical protein
MSVIRNIVLVPGPTALYNTQSFMFRALAARLEVEYSAIKGHYEEEKSCNLDPDGGFEQRDIIDETQRRNSMRRSHHRAQLLFAHSHISL